jgi:hypothetical protein
MTGRVLLTTLSGAHTIDPMTPLEPDLTALAAA